MEQRQHRHDLAEARRVGRNADAGRAGRDHAYLVDQSFRLGRRVECLELRIYWDGRKEPGVEAPLGDFFAVGQGKPAVVESMPVQVSPTGALTCYWRMPFRNRRGSWSPTTIPDRSRASTGRSIGVQLDSLPPDTPYFYARYRQEYPAVTGRDYLFADLEGSG